MNIMELEITFRKEFFISTNIRREKAKEMLGNT